MARGETAQRLLPEQQHVPNHDLLHRLDDNWCAQLLAASVAAHGWTRQHVKNIFVCAWPLAGTTRVHWTWAGAVLLMAGCGRSGRAWAGG